MKAEDQEPRSLSDLLRAVQEEGNLFQDYYLWLQENMPASFFQEVSSEHLMLITHNLMGFHVQNYFSQIYLKNMSIVLCLDVPGADIKVLKNYQLYGIKSYHAYNSEAPPPIPGMDARLRIAVIYFTEVVETGAVELEPQKTEEVKRAVQERNPQISEEEINNLLKFTNTRFQKSLTTEKLILAMDMFFRAKTRDLCQYELVYNKDWEKTNRASLEIVLAWKNIPKQHFLYRLARLVHRHGLVMDRASATYIDPYSAKTILIMSIGLHGADGNAAWEVADIPDFLRELVTLKNFGDFDPIDSVFVSPGLIRGNLGNLLRTMKVFIHQVLVHADPHKYAMEYVDEALCRHPEITIKLLEAFEYKFHPELVDLEKYQSAHEDFHDMVSRLDTGHVDVDQRRRNILRQGMNMVDYCLKNNFYRNNKSGFSFRMDPAYLNRVPYDRKRWFPELPYAIFFVKGMHYFGFQIRFRDLARGGLRTVFTKREEAMVVERNTIFSEGYNLAYTQQKKNKDIPEGGAKGVIFLKPYHRLEAESEILQKEFKQAGFTPEEIKEKLEIFRQEQITEYLYQTQRSFIACLLTLINCEEDGSLRAKHVIDYWKRPEYIYLGPDENMHNNMIEWIADFSRLYNYKPGGSFISSKPSLGINHKEYGVTSLGVNVYMHELLKHLGIDPEKDSFTLKMTGGPDGDVAGNQIKNLYTYYRNTAKLVALTDGSGTIFDPEGLDLDELLKLFEAGSPIAHYPENKLNEGAFLLDKDTKREHSAFAQETLCWRKRDGKLEEDWLSGNDMHKLYRDNVHKTKCDVFIPAGGRPRTLHAENWKDFLDENEQPTSRGIVEGANLYLTKEARQALESKGVLIIKDSSANKGGVICSSFEVLSGLTLGDEVFMENKAILVEEILEALKEYARKEAHLLLHRHQSTRENLTDISEEISKRINLYTDQLMSYFDRQEPIGTDPTNPLVRCFLSYCLPTLRTRFSKELLENIPDIHKKAIIASHIAAQIVYHRGLNWGATIVDILPIIWSNPRHYLEIEL